MAEKAGGFQGCLSLVGLRGAGKSTVGRLLAKRMGATFLDLDLELARRFGAPQESAGALLARVGEAAFRDFEERALAACLGALTDAPRSPRVLATGGGAVLRPVNRALLIEQSFCVWLQASSGELCRRITEPASGTDANHASSPETWRPPLTDLSPDLEMATLLAERAVHYAEVADLEVETEGCAPELVASQIFSKLPQ